MNRTQQIMSVQPLQERRQTVIWAAQHRDGRLDSLDQFTRQRPPGGECDWNCQQKISKRKQATLQRTHRDHSKKYYVGVHLLITGPLNPGSNSAGSPVGGQWQSGGYFTAAFTQSAPHMRRVRQWHRVALRGVQARWVDLNGSSQEEVNAKQRV